MLKLIELQILKNLLNSQFVEIEKIMNFYNISNTLAKKHLYKINSFLKLYFDVQLNKKNNCYYIPQLNSLKNISQTSYEPINFEKTIRIDYIFIKLIFERQINILNIAEELEVTRMTVHKDMILVKKKLKKFNLTISSSQWKGIELIGKENDIFIFFIEFFTRIQCLNFCENNLYFNIVNPKLGIYLKKYISSTDLLYISLCSKEIIKHLDYTPNFYQFESFKSGLVYCKLFKKNIKKLIFPKSIESIRLFNNYYYLIRKNTFFSNLAIKNLKPFIYILYFNDSKILSSSDFYDKYINLSSFIQDIENLFELKFSQRNKFQICILLTSSLFKKRHDLADYLNLNDNISVNSESNFLQLEELIKKYYKTFFKEDIFRLYFFIKNIKKNNLSNESKQKKILFIDESIDLWLGMKLKKIIENNFKLVSIDLLSYFDIPNHQIKYDHILFINCKNYTKNINSSEFIYLGEDLINFKDLNFLDN